MENLPVEVIGNILSRLGDARYVVMASGFSKKWRQAYCQHVDTLSFNCDDWPGYLSLGDCHLQDSISRAIFHTTGLQDLSIWMSDYYDSLSASTVSAWLLYTKQTLRRLIYRARAYEDANVLEVCGRQKLEVLKLSSNSIVIGAEPNDLQPFLRLKSLSLFHVRMQPLDLNRLLANCPKLEKVELIGISSDLPVGATVEWSSPTLKSFLLGEVNLDKLILKAENIEYLRMRRCTLELFELIGKGTLKQFCIDGGNVTNLHVGGEAADNVEVADISNLTIAWPNLYEMISKSSKLRRLELWDVKFDDVDETLDLDTISACFPQLSHFSLRHGLTGGGSIHYGLERSSSLENVTVLELGWNAIDDLFSGWVEGHVKRCPHLKKLVIHGVISQYKAPLDCEALANFTSSIVQLMRRYMQVDFQLQLE